MLYTETGKKIKEEIKRKGTRRTWLLEMRKLTLSYAVATVEGSRGVWTAHRNCLSSLGPKSG